jgi:hypothetical protein
MRSRSSDGGSTGGSAQIEVLLRRCDPAIQRLAQKSREARTEKEAQSLGGSVPLVERAG